jgi:NadR type nicotinamide-nucleotide adenylyltransferase
MIKIAFTGPESSGKTTLCEGLSKQLNCPWVPEFAREYLENKENYNLSDLDAMAEEQARRWETCIDQKLILCDTEMLVFKIWSEVKFGGITTVIQQLYENQHFDLYFLCKPDIPWEEDPLRENQSNRDELFELYLTELIKTNRPFITLYGSLENRITEAKNIITKIL